MPDIDAFTEGLKEYLDDQAVNLVRQAYICAEKAHEGQFRRSGEPYIIHPLAVAKILAGLRMDPQTLMAALLHDVIEDTDVAKEELAAQFGDVVAELVDGVSKLTQIEFKSKAEAQAENFRKMTLAMAKDIRVILVKLADRLHNMRTLGPLHPEKRRRIATETLDIYAPIANRLGINSIRIELEDLGFAALYPMRAKYIRKAVQNLRGNHQEIIGEIKRRLEEKLSQRDLEGVIIGREKHLNSIYQKMKYKHKSFHEIMDVYAFRIVTDSEDSCYRILGAVHSLYKPLPGRFKDYIAMPKANGYQSLHTTLFGMHVNIEIQIRTSEMEALANNGIAAHWLYKSSSPDVAAASQVRVDRWVKGLMEMRDRADDSMEFIEDVKIDLFPDEIYVFTPKGKILELPAGATPVDFAYSIHTDVGNACVACRVNKVLSPLSVPLQSGQTIEIVTAPGAKPSMSWLNFVVTGKAKSGIRHFLKEQKQSESSELGRLLLKKSLNSFGKTLSDIPEERIKRVVQHNKVGSFDDILEEIGLGSRMSYIVARQLVPVEGDEEELEILQSDDSENALTIKGAEGLLVSYAHCCKPIPGDPIVGIMGSGSGMTIHAESCTKLSSKGRKQQDGKEQGGWVTLDWAKDITDEFSVELKIGLERHRGIIAEIASAVTLADGNIEKINVEEQNAQLSVISLVVHVQGRRHLARLMRRIRNMKAVISISRVKN
ncbi:RelA/SpoT family protein [Alkalimarinus sediminis]|uniref:guanosine-3',5'-bis(diphosphate) 3'-diphosphatase n=1 Tax=Alkalimarinus sediminis TaxID=1632866 RepID=A0A9E8KPF6_9ALTE|nr:RelA/SpoT family protein [Alkalimarinus sediminis]UZW75323.1 RelA/SpoT family protein [Alkalimarinus sediminis]